MATGSVWLAYNVVSGFTILLQVLDVQLVELEVRHTQQTALENGLELVKVPGSRLSVQPAIECSH